MTKPLALLSIDELHHERILARADAAFAAATAVLAPSDLGAQIDVARCALNMSRIEAEQRWREREAGL